MLDKERTGADTGLHGLDRRIRSSLVMTTFWRAAGWTLLSVSDLAAALAIPSSLTSSFVLIMNVCLLMLTSLIFLVASIAYETVHPTNHAENLQDTHDFMDGPTNGKIEHHFKDNVVTTGSNEPTAIAIETKQTEAVNKFNAKGVTKGLHRMRISSHDDQEAYHLIDITENAEATSITIGESLKNNRIRGSTTKPDTNPESIGSTTNDHRNLHFAHHHHSGPTLEIEDDHNAMIDRSFELPRMRYHEFSIPNTTPEGY